MMNLEVGKRVRHIGYDEKGVIKKIIKNSAGKEPWTKYYVELDGGGTSRCFNSMLRVVTCESCDSELLFNQKKEEYFCPFCNEEQP